MSGGNGSARLGQTDDTGIVDFALADRLEQERDVWLCTLHVGGSPHVTPVWFVHPDDTFWINSGERNVKVRNVMNDPG